MLVFIVCCVLFVDVVRSRDPNFVFVLTDDQDLLLNGLVPMRKTLQLVANEGATFKNAFVNTPLCCPSRSTILTGRYAHNIEVLNNSLSGGCSGVSWQRNHERNSIANVLKIRKGYTTFYAGKYLNQYGMDGAGGFGYVPAGYDWWLGLKGNSKYYDYSLSINGTKTDFTDRYLTDLISDYAIDFLNQKRTVESPFFMMLAPPACHSPFTPAKRHDGIFKGVKAPRTPNFNYSSDDKHWLVQMSPKFLPSNVTILDTIQQRRMETLLSVDELVERVVAKLRELSLLDDTYVVFTSDNGFHIGQFTQPWDKRQPYETDIKIPFLMRGPNVRKKSLVADPISAIDVMPTILDLASIPKLDDVDGVSFRPLLLRGDSETKGNSHVFIEYFGEASPETIDKNCHYINSNDLLSQCTLENWCKCQDSRNNTYVCVKVLGRYEDFKYCQFSDDSEFTEAYDLVSDPYELKNIYHKLSSTRTSFYKKLLCEFKK